MKRLAAIIPGLPHLLHPERSPQWKSLADAMITLRGEIEKEKPDVLVMQSSQWLSVLGTSFQTAKNPKGIHVDENWHEWGDLPFDFKTDAALATACAAAVEAAGYPTKCVDYEEFPIDTGTIVAMRFLNPKGTIPVVLLSSWVYANAEVACKIGEVVAKTFQAKNVRPFYLASSLLTARYFTDEIDPNTDRISSEADEHWMRNYLPLWERGDLKAASEAMLNFAKSSPTDMQGNSFHWLSGVFNGTTQIHGNVLRMGSLWGTGAAVIKIEGTV